MPTDYIWIAQQSEILIKAKHVDKVQGADCDFPFYMVEIRDGYWRFGERK